MYLVYMVIAKLDRPDSPEIASVLVSCRALASRRSRTFSLHRKARHEQSIEAKLIPVQQVLQQPAGPCPFQQPRETFFHPLQRRVREDGDVRRRPGARHGTPRAAGRGPNAVVEERARTPSPARRMERDGLAVGGVGTARSVEAATKLLEGTARTCNCKEIINFKYFREYTSFKPQCGLFAVRHSHVCGRGIVSCFCLCCSS